LPFISNALPLGWPDSTGHICSLPKKIAPDIRGYRKLEIGYRLLLSGNPTNRASTNEISSSISSLEPVLGEQTLRMK
jgi:hypothetical protein